MSNSNPVMRSPLNHFNLAQRQQPLDDSRGVWANEVPLLGYISLRGNTDNPAFVAAVNSALGCSLPIQPCALQETNWGTILWLSPDEWLLVCEREQRATLQASLETALAGIHSQVADNSGGYTKVALQGLNAEDVLRHCTVYDLAHLGTGRVVGTSFGKMTTFLLHSKEGYSLVFRRSFADYIWRLLERSAEPYGFGVAAPSVRKTTSSTNKVVEAA